MITLGIDDQITPVLLAMKSMISDTLPEGVEELSEALQQELKTVAPIDTYPRATGYRNPPGQPGKLRESIRFDLVGNQANFYAVDYSKYVIDGTPPHVIRAKNAKSLMFFWKVAGGTVFFMQVNHPGTKANDFRIPALNETEDYADTVLEVMAEQILGAVG